MSRVQAKPDFGSPWPALEPGALRALEPIRRLPGRNGTKADILVYRSRGVEIAVKDYAGRPFLTRQLIGRFLIRRESAAHRAASGVRGIPRFLGRVGPFALATEWVEARPLSSCDKGDLDAACFARARGIVADLHRRGIALANLHHRNLLVAPEGEVYVVDLATAWVLGPRPSRLSRRVYQRLREQDELALARLEARFADQDPDQVPARIGGRAEIWFRRGRAARAVLDRLRRRKREP